MLASGRTMAETPSTLLTIGLAQIDCRLGDVERNAERHLEWIQKARAAGVDLLVFPELSLTGYRLLHLTPRVAMPADARGARLRRGGGARGFAQQRRPALGRCAVLRSPQALPADLWHLPGGALLRRRPPVGAGGPAVGQDGRAHLRGPLAPGAGPPAGRGRHPADRRPLGQP